MSDRNQYWRRTKIKTWRPKSRNNNNSNKDKDNASSGRNQAFVPTVEPPRLSDLQHQNRVKTRRFFLKKQQPEVHTPHAPRNTSSFIMRAKTSGGIASFVSPTPTTPALLATPDMSRAPSYREGIVDEVNKEWGVNGYGSMNGLIRLRTSEDTLRDESGSDSDADQEIESVQQLEQRLDQDLNRFEIVYPPTNSSSGFDATGTQVEDQESHIAHLEEENLLLKERIFLLEQQVEELKQQLKIQEGGENLDEMEVCSEKSAGDGSSSGQ